MNFKTTIVLLVTLVIVGGFILFSNSGTETAKTESEVAAGDRKLFDTKPEDITRISVLPSDGKPFLIEKTGVNWKLIEPVATPAETQEAENLARALVELRSHGTMVPSSENSAATGLDHPRYKIEFNTKDRKTYKLNVGEKSPVGDNLYVRAHDSKTADVVSASFLDQLEKPATAYRDPRLVSVTSPDVKQITIQRPDATIKLERAGPGWRMTEPKQFVADAGVVDDVLFSITGLRAADWVAEEIRNLTEARSYQLDTPRLSVVLSTTQPSTQPTTVAAADAAPAPAPATQPVTIKFGRYDDVLKKNVLAVSTQTPAVAKVAATILETLNKKPIEFRDKTVLRIDPGLVSSISIAADFPATTRPAKPALKKEIVLKRHVQTLPVGVAAPGTQPATLPATNPARKWDLALAGDKLEAADDAKVDELLVQINPLRADRYLESNPTTQPAPTYTFKITIQGPGGAAPEDYTMTVTDPGLAKSPIVAYQDLMFEVPRFLVEKLDSDFKKSAAPAIAPNVANGPPESP